MQEYTKKPENISRTLDSKPKASKQGSISEILQAYKNGTLQRMSVDEEELLQAKTRDKSSERETLQRYTEYAHRDRSGYNALIQGVFGTPQLKGIEDDELLQGKFDSSSAASESTVQREVKPNNTGLPDNLKSGIENLSGYSMDDVKVHYNSDKPAQLSALAYAQGTDIHVAPGQEKHLPHEAWHVLQQKQGRVQPTMQMQGVDVNDNEGLEREADVMGERTLQMKEVACGVKIAKKEKMVIQRTITIFNEDVFQYTIIKKDIQYYKDRLETSIPTYIANLEARRSNAPGGRILDIYEVKKSNCLIKLQADYTNWISQYKKVIPKMPDIYYVTGYEPLESLEYAIIKMKDELFGFIDDYNDIFNNTFEDKNSTNIVVNKLVVKEGINLSTLEADDTDGVFNLLRNGTLTDRHKSVIGIGRPQHQHLHGGDKGIAFSYKREMNGSITPYLYDYANTRQGNKYVWIKAGIIQSGPPSVKF